MGLPVGAKIPLHQLVPAMMMASGNDAAEVVAATISHSDRAFTRRMNQTAKRWHLGQIHFDNPTGLRSKSQWTTAMAMARLTLHVMRNRVFATMVRQAAVVLPNPDTPRFYVNQNQMIGTFPGANGVKLGYTGPGNAALVVTAMRHHTELVVVVLHDNLAALWPDATRLLVWGFAHSGYRSSQDRVRHGTIRPKGVLEWRNFGSGTAKTRP